MRVDELAVPVPGGGPADELTIRFHEHMTVLFGLDVLERRALIETMLGILSGRPERSGLVYRDGQGRRVSIAADGFTATTRYDDGSEAPPTIGTLVSSPDELRSLVVLGAVNGSEVDDADPELAEARRHLAALDAELRAAMERRRRADDRLAELAALDLRINDAEEGVARRAYGRLLAALELVRAEAAVIRTGDAGGEADRRLTSEAPSVLELGAAHRAAAERLSRTEVALAGHERIDDETATVACSYPESAPDALVATLARLAAARAERDRLETRHRDLAASRLPTPSDPRVVDLASVDQSELWTARDTVVECAAALEAERLALGGIGATEGDAPAVVEIEDCHRRLEEAAAALRVRAVPLGAGCALALTLTFILTIAGSPLAGVALVLGAIGAAAAVLGPPARQFFAARGAEEDALVKVGAPTYLAFHLRRVEAAVTPGARSRLDATAMAHRLASVRWLELSNGIELAEAQQLESEVRAFARALDAMGGAATELRAIRDELERIAGPAVASAEAEAAAMVEPFGIDAAAVSDDPDVLAKLVDRQAALGRAARAQVSLDMRRREVSDLADALGAALRELGIGDGELDQRLATLPAQVASAEARQEARRRARPREEVEADLQRLQDEVRRARRPEWDDVEPADADEPDVDGLQAARERLTAEMRADGIDPGELERVADRHGAIRRRVAALEARLAGPRGELGPGRYADLQNEVLAHLGQASHRGADDEPLPVLVDELFIGLAPEQKWELLDLLRRVGESAQVVYLSDDPDVASWARRRASAGLISLLEPVDA